MEIFPSVGHQWGVQCISYKKHFFNEQKVGMLLQKRTDTRGVGISNMRKSIYLLTTTPSSHTHGFHPHPPPANHTHRFHPLSTIVIHTLNLCKVQRMDDIVESGWNVWVWLAGGGCGWNLWVWLVGVVLRRYIDFIILLIPTPLVSVLFCSSIPTFCSFF